MAMLGGAQFLMGEVPPWGGVYEALNTLSSIIIGKWPAVRVVRHFGFTHETHALLDAVGRAPPPRERLFMDNLLVRFHLIIEMFSLDRPRAMEVCPFPGSPICTFLKRPQNTIEPSCEFRVS